MKLEHNCVTIFIFSLIFIFTTDAISQDIGLREFKKHISQNRIHRLSNGYEASLEILNDGLFLNCRFEGEQVTSVKIGQGGTITNWDFDGSEMISPPYREEITDRVIQWTVWSDSIKAPLESGSGERRYNLTQAGTGSSHDVVFYPNSIAPTIMSVWYGDIGVLDVFTLQGDQWQQKNQSYINGNITSLTRYSYIRDGKLLIRRFLLVGPTLLNNRSVHLQKLYVEGWTPISRSNSDALAIAINSEGEPAWYYHADSNIPSYPAFPVNNTYGYAVTYSKPKLEGVKFCVVYGTSSPVIDPSGRGLKATKVLNTMVWDTGIGVLPAINLEIPQNSQDILINQNLIMFPSDSPGRELKSQLDACNQILPKNLIHIRGEMGAEIQLIRRTLQSFSKQAGQRLTNLGATLIRNLNEAVPSKAEINTHPGILLQGEIGDKFEILSTENPDDSSSWATEAVIFLDSPRFTWFDQQPVDHRQRKYYRVYKIE